MTVKSLSLLNLALHLLDSFLGARDMGTAYG